MLDELIISEPKDGLVGIRGSVEQVADLLTRMGYPTDAERLLAAQERRHRRALKRMPRGGVACLDDGCYEPVPR